MLYTIFIYNYIYLGLDPHGDISTDSAIQHIVGIRLLRKLKKKCYKSGLFIDVKTRRTKENKRKKRQTIRAKKVALKKKQSKANIVKVKVHI